MESLNFTNEANRSCCSRSLNWLKLLSDSINILTYCLQLICVLFHPVSSCFILFHPVSPATKLLSDLQYFAAPRHTQSIQSKSHQRIRNRSNAGLERPDPPASSDLGQKKDSLTLIYEICDFTLKDIIWPSVECGQENYIPHKEKHQASWLTQTRQFTHRGAWKLGTKFGATVLRNGFAGSGSTLGIAWLLLFRPIKLA